ADNDVALLRQVLDKEIRSPRDVRPDLPEALAALVLEGLRRDSTERVSTALEYATRLEEIVGLPNPREIGQAVRTAARDQLAARARRVADVESVATQPTGAPVEATIPPSTERTRAARPRLVRSLLVAAMLAAPVAGFAIWRTPRALGVAA